MVKPILVIMAAGLGSRYGGLKQMAPVDDEGQILMDYSIFDALRAGFGRVVCVIKPEHEKDFREIIGSRLGSETELCFAFQRPDILPAGYTVPQGRVKPWGTAHAVLCAKEYLDAPFCVINADDFYGRTAFEAIARFLTEEHSATEHAMVGYKIENTLTENGSVARGVCETNEDGMLIGIHERTCIEPRPGGAAFIEDGQETFIPAGVNVSMNLWGFQPTILAEMEKRFAPWLEANLPVIPLKCEYFLPLIPNQLLQEGKATVQVLPTQERWYGMTYAGDMPGVQAALQQLREQGEYPAKLWGQSIEKARNV
ncbi:MAG: sugar phosphate nucleotidyltransferase [Eubacteriales bacterium]|nr:sugar phosphate nucleotidyltransferase [Eubacteriales bacterium]